jgi:hypothetical protein
MSWKKKSAKLRINSCLQCWRRGIEKFLLVSMLVLKGLVPRAEGLVVKSGVEHALLLRLISDIFDLGVEVEPSFWSTCTMNDYIAFFKDFSVDGSPMSLPLTLGSLL